MKIWNYRQSVFQSSNLVCWTMESNGRICVLWTNKEGPASPTQPPVNKAAVRKRSPVWRFAAGAPRGGDYVATAASLLSKAGWITFHSHSILILLALILAPEPMSFNLVSRICPGPVRGRPKLLCCLNTQWRRLIVPETLPPFLPSKFSFASLSLFYSLSRTAVQFEHRRATLLTERCRASSVHCIVAEG